MRRFILIAAMCGGAVALGGVATATAFTGGGGGGGGGSGDIVCPGLFTGNAPHDLIVVPGTPCTADRATVGHDVIVQPGGNFTDIASTVNHDIRADHPDGIGIGGDAPGPGGSGHVGHDVTVDGVTGGVSPFGDNYVCNTFIGHDLTIQNSAAGAGPWDIGDFETECHGGGDQVVHDLNVNNNHNHVDVSENGTNPGGLPGGVGHDLNVQNNAPGFTVEGNVAGHNANCSPGNTPDGDQTPNSPANSSCNTFGGGGGGGGGGIS